MRSDTEVVPMVPEDRRSRVVDPTGRLSPRQFETVLLLSEGHTRAEICELMFAAYSTVREHGYQARDKLGLHHSVTDARLVAVAIQLGIVEVKPHKLDDVGRPPKESMRRSGSLNARA